MNLMQDRGSQSFVLRYLIATPLIWAMVIPVLFADLCIEIYHRIAFPIFGIKTVRRSDYIRIVDRAKLPYLSWPERLGCAYCGYVNGWLHYASTIAGRTESYFCAIKHLQTRGYQPTEHELSFMKYGDDAALRRRYAAHHARVDSTQSNS